MKLPLGSVFNIYIIDKQCCSGVVIVTED